MPKALVVAAEKIPLNVPNHRFETFLLKKNNNKAGVVYKIPCNQCEKIYIGETGRQLGTRITEHRKEAEKISDRNFTRSTRRASTNAGS